MNSPAVVRRSSLISWYVLGTLLAVFTYFYGLDSDHAPKNGDEFVYAHITRVTAKSGRWLPLQSELAGMRNTKPPLIFWQGIVSTKWGADWTLRRLRYPSVIYTLLTGLLVFGLGWRLTRRAETAFLGFLTFLAFFGTYRYGRPYLTDPPEIFWLFLPFFVLLYWQEAAFASRFLVPLLVGLGIGIGLLYKSFALALPVFLCLTCWYLLKRGNRLEVFLARDAGKLVFMGVISVAVFGLWFVLDPNPQAVWKEFVVGENLGKFDPKKGNYVSRLLWGGSSIWRVVAGYPLNAGLLAFPVIALSWDAWRRRRELGEAEKLLWIWILTLFVVFSLPSQRDERYLLPGMPALAILCALNWERIYRVALVATLVAAGAVVAVLGYLSVRLEQGMPGVQLYSALYWVFLAGALILILLGVLVPRFTTPSTCVGAILVCLSFAAFLRPFDGPIGNFSAEARQYAKGREVWVPINFRAKDEGHRFLLPGAEVHGYDSKSNLTVAELSERFPLFTVRLPMLETNTAGAKVIGERLDLGSRHTTHQILEIVGGKVYEHLFLKELLMEAAAPGAAGTSAPR